MSDYIERALQNYAEAWRQNQGQTKEAIDEMLKSLKIQDSPLQSQVGGDHYKEMPIQPVTFCERNRLSACESAVVKYVCRHRRKNGRQDLEKAIHYLQILIEENYPE